MTSLFNLLGPQAPDNLDPADRWQQDALCANPVYDPEDWFPVGEGPTAQQQAAGAKAVCHRCPVIDACLRWALNTGQDTGVWGGLSERERHNLRRRRGRAVASSSELQEMAQEKLDEHSVPAGEHLQWQGSPSIRLKGVVTTPKRIAWVAAHGAPPTAPLIVSCGLPTCILPAHMQLQTAGAPDTLTADEATAHQKDVYETRSVDVGDGHREWRASEPVTVLGASYTARQLAWTIAHGERPAGVLTVTCGHKGCITVDHLHDRGVRAPGSGETAAEPVVAAPTPRRVAECGTRPGYQKHRREGEPACDACRQANADADRRLRNTGTTKQLAA